ncbi:helix-turn-helix domain-containing protein [Halorarius litoreus]|uniref:helix-turn-helix domain-containing protein n=1 Tax=Halorarius litoreus TaxID=2962676 RepID=UPI0020CDA6D4|nr:helix-turn-helix domain-containing protein [Halorarius litoreus]
MAVTLRIGGTALERAATAAPDVTVTVEQQGRTVDGRLDLTTWAAGGDVEAFEAGLDVDETVDRWLVVGARETETLYRIRLTPDASEALDYDAWTDGRLVLRAARRRHDGWLVAGFVTDRSVLPQLAAGCSAHDVAFDLVRTAETDGLTGPELALTETQRETLLTAFDRGLYSVPRGATIEELAEPLDVSHQAVSERLRRGVHSLIQTTICDERDDGAAGLPADGVKRY